MKILVGTMESVAALVAAGIWIACSPASRTTVVNDIGCEGGGDGEDAPVQESVGGTHDLETPNASPPDIDGRALADLVETTGDGKADGVDGHGLGDTDVSDPGPTDSSEVVDLPDASDLVDLADDSDVPDAADAGESLDQTEASEELEVGEEVCVPDCADKECGADGCSGECGQCQALAWVVCMEGLCVDVCDKPCLGRECGKGKCNVDCGECDVNEVCTDLGQCVPASKCQIHCGEVMCGPGGCGDECGPGCPADTYCTGGQCTESCVPACAGKECGPDGCGGACGTCPAGLQCTNGFVCGGPCSQCPLPDECRDIDFSKVSPSWLHLVDGALVGEYVGIQPLSGGAMLKLSGQVELQFCIEQEDQVVSIIWAAVDDGSPGYPLGCAPGVESNDMGQCYSKTIYKGINDYRFGFGFWSFFCAELSCSFICPDYDPICCGLYGECCIWANCYTCDDAKSSCLSKEISPYARYHTGWMESSWVLEQQDDKPYLDTFKIECSYPGGHDGIMLIDHISLVPKSQFCSNRECGTATGSHGNLKDVDCGTCPQGKVCGIGGHCEPKCVPDCQGKECGPNGCGGHCGLCKIAQEVCTPSGMCVPIGSEEVDASCDGIECGWSWGGDCGKCEGCGQQCVDNQCVLDPCFGKECGDDGCGGTCGLCGPGGECFFNKCLYPSCDGKECGLDGHDGWCGRCLEGAGCVEGKCVPMTCGGKECGDNGFGGTCGYCDAPALCLNGTCITYNACGKCAPDEVCGPGPEECCQPACEGKECGDDGCGGVCGECGCGETCWSGGCMFVACEGKECGEDECGSLCGDCPEEQVCHEGSCCTPKCNDVECGPDGCGGWCGLCKDGDECTLGVCSADGQCEQRPFCCQKDTDCSDGGDVCTDVLCSDGKCVFPETVLAGCCHEEILSLTAEKGLPDSAWVIDSEEGRGWNIGSNKTSVWEEKILCNNHGGGDPQVDFTSTLELPPIGIGAASLAPVLTYEFKGFGVYRPLSVVVAAAGEQHTLAVYDDEVAEWTVAEHSLSEFAGQTITVSFTLDAAGAIGFNNGWAMDNIRVTQECCSDAVVCDDGNLCTDDLCAGPGSLCQNLWQLGCCLDHADCNDGDACTLDLCLAPSACHNVPSCCAENEHCVAPEASCVAATCVGGECEYDPTFADGCCQEPLFFDDFSTDKGWEYGDHWERGPAATAPCKQSYPDPQMDYTPTSDNYLAGVEIGGCIQGQAMSFSYLTSPSIQTDGENKLFLAYALWLNHKTNDTSWCTVDVFDGKKWVNIWKATNTNITDMNEWKQQVHDLSVYANDQLRVRFGFNLVYWKVVEISSWNIDDVRILTSADPGDNCCTWQGDCDALGQECLFGQCE